MRAAPGSETILGIPRSHWEKQLSNYDWSTRPNTATVVWEFIRKAQQREAPHLLLCGNVGTGKTHIGVGLFRWAAMLEGTMRSAFINMPEFYKLVKSNYGTGHDPIDDIRSADFLVVMDDPFAGNKLHPGDFDILFSCIDIVYQNRAAMVWTMNDDLEYLRSTLQDHEYDRVMANSQVCEFTGPSWRIT